MKKWINNLLLNTKSIPLMHEEVFAKMDKAVQLLGFSAEDRVNSVLQFPIYRTGLQVLGC